MKTFSVNTLGCRVNHYEAEQIAALLRERGLTQVAAPGGDVRVVHTCSVTTEAATKSRQATRRATRLPVLGQYEAAAGDAKVIVTGCWASSDKDTAENIPGVVAVLAHTDDVRGRLEALLDEWLADAVIKLPLPVLRGRGGEGVFDGGRDVYGKDAGPLPNPPPAYQERGPERGFAGLPLLGSDRQSHQRAFLKVQDGCDAHCTYCIIPQLRPTLWSKSPDDAVDETAALVRTGHREIVLTGIFLGAFGRATALRRRQPRDAKPLAALVDALCTRVPGLARLRLSSLEPGDLDAGLLAALRRHPQVVPHFHLPLQSGSDAVLRRMNRQYGRAEFLEMADAVRAAFDRPALTTDVIVGFPGEDAAAFADTLAVVRYAGFVHTHVFPYSPRPNTAAARWTDRRVPPQVARERIDALRRVTAETAAAFVGQFVGETAGVLVERSADPAAPRHGRSERYFDVAFPEPAAVGDSVRVRIDRTEGDRAFGSRVA